MPPAIIDKQPKSGMFRARDVRANIKELGFEKGAELSLTLVADEMAGIRQSITELTNMVNQCIDLISNMTTINGEMAQQIDRMKRNEDQFESVRGEGVTGNG